MRRTLAAVSAAGVLAGLIALVPAASAAPATSAAACKLANAPNIMPNYIGEGFPVSDLRMKTQGPVRIALLFVDFPGAASKDPTPQRLWDILQPAQAFFRSVSYGRMQATLVPYLKWVRMSKRAAAYGVRRYANLTGAGLQAYMQEAVSKADKSVDFGGIDGVVVVSTPEAGNAIDYSPAFVASSRSGGLVTNEGVITSGSTAASDVWGDNGWGWRILPHELGHAMGLADLYDGYGEGRYGLHGYVGIWDLMSNPASPTPEYNAWNRWLLGWVSDKQIVCAKPRGSTNATLTAVEAMGGTKAVVVPVSKTKAVVIESRRPIGYDVAEYLGSPIEAGALVYVVNTATPTLHGPIRVVTDDRGDPIFDLTTAPLQPGDSVSVEGLRVSVVSATSAGDTVRIESR